MPIVRGRSLSAPIPIRGLTASNGTRYPASANVSTHDRAWASLLSTSVPSMSKITPLSKRLFQILLNRFSEVEVSLYYRRRFLDQVLQLGVLRLVCCACRFLQNLLVRIYLGVDVGLVEVLAFGRG